MEVTQRLKSQRFEYDNLGARPVSTGTCNVTRMVARLLGCRAENEKYFEGTFFRVCVLGTV